jgi:hypothetical protein
MTEATNDAVELLRALPLEAFDTPKPDDAWARCALASASDEILIRSVAASIACPKVQIRSSFLLHAPLELLARAWLLRHLPAHKREHARRRIAEIAVRYAGEGPEIHSTHMAYSGVDHALQELSAGLRAGDADAVDGAFLFLRPRISTERFRAALAEEMLPSLGAAAHAPILLMMLAGAAGNLPDISALLRSPLRSLALQADQRLTWMDCVEQTTPADGPVLFDCLAAPPRVESSSSAIMPIMLAVERDGYAARILTDPTMTVTVREAERILLRTAALSMLQDDPAQAPYGWTHCFTLPQGILAQADVVSDATRLVRIAATHVLGFRATLGRARLQYPYIPGRRMPYIASQGDPADAAALAFNAAGEQRGSIKTLLIERAAGAADSHLAKYTMSCLTAADRDPQESALFLAAAAYLGAWWDRR